MTVNIQEAEAKRDHGMSISEIKANNDSAEWSSKARLAVIGFIQSSMRIYNGDRFLVEEVRDWAEALELIEPPANGRAWGAVIRRCAKEGIIRKDGYLPARSSNMSPKTAWVSNL